MKLEFWDTGWEAILKPLPKIIKVSPKFLWNSVVPNIWPTSRRHWKSATDLGDYYPKYASPHTRLAMIIKISMCFYVLFFNWHAGQSRLIIICTRKSVIDVKVDILAICTWYWEAWFGTGIYSPTLTPLLTPLHCAFDLSHIETELWTIQISCTACDDRLLNEQR